MIQTFDTACAETLTVDYSKIRSASRKGLEAIKSELPEEAQTTEGFSLVFGEMKEQVRSAKIIL